MTVREFYKTGFVQEINRRLLHPCGIALTLCSDERGHEWLGILDCRDEPEGLYYQEEELSRAKASAVFDLFNSKLAHRREVFGHIIQPVPEKELSDE